MKTPFANPAPVIRSPRSGRHMLDGTLWILMAESLILPTGLVSAAVLTRRLGAADYGLLTLATVIVAWIQWSVTSLFARTTVKFVSEADDWRPVGGAVIRLNMVASCAAALLLAALARPVASLLGEAVLVSYLRLLALDIPLFALAYGHRHILIGLGHFRQRALATAGRWVSRLLLIVIFIELGFSVTGAILGQIGASLVELAICRYYVRPSLFTRSTFSARRLWSYALPLFVFALSMRLFDKLDLFVLKATGGSAELAGVYGAAQNLALAPGLFALSFSPLLLSNLGHLLRAEHDAQARTLARNAMRVVLLLLPMAAMSAAAAPELVTAIFGRAFLPAAPILAILMFGGVAAVMISVATTILTATGRPWWAAVLAAPLVPAAIVGHLLSIPRLGAIGASLVTTILATLGALAAVAAVYRHWSVAPPRLTLARSIMVSLLAYTVTLLWSAPGGQLLLKLPIICALVVVAFAALGEFSVAEINALYSSFRWRASPAESPREV